MAKLLPNATHILDRFHIEAKLNEAVDKVRRAEARELAGKGLVVLKNLRYAFLKRPENLTDGQRDGLQKIVNKRSLKTVRAYHWKESFRLFWEYECPAAASKFLRRWCRIRQYWRFYRHRFGKKVSLFRTKIVTHFQ